MSIPNTDIVLCNNVPLDLSYDHTIDFDDLAAQTSYFNAKASFTFNDITYIKTTDSFKVVGGLETFIYVTYCFYTNMAGKRIYAFITDKKYINDNCTEMFMKIDVMQTYQFNYTFKHSMVDREHVDRWYSAGSPIMNLVEENLDYGNNYRLAQQTVYSGNQPWDWFLVVATEALGTDPLGVSAVQGVPTPFHFYLIPHNRSIASTYTAKGASSHSIIAGNTFSTIAAELKIISVSYIHYLPIDVSIVLSGSEYTFTCAGAEFVPTPYNATGTYILKLTETTRTNTVTQLGSHSRYSDIIMPASFSATASRSYTYESKLLFYPYLYYLMTDHQSTPTLIKNELLPATVVMKAVQGLSAQPKVKYYIDNYNGVDSEGKYTNVMNTSVNDLGLSSDAYINYMQNNKASAISGIGLALAGGAISLGVGAATGGVGLAMGAGVALSSFSTVAGELAKRKDLVNMPDNARSYGNNIAFDMIDNNRSLYMFRFEISDTYKRIIGDYFALYGYKSNVLKVPSLRTRLRYNFIKTLQCNLASVNNSGVPSPHMEKLQDIYNKGVTIWHHRSGYAVDVKNYQYDNVEVSLI